MQNKIKNLNLEVGKNYIFQVSDGQVNGKIHKIPLINAPLTKILKAGESLIDAEIAKLGYREVNVYQEYKDHCMRLDRKKFDIPEDQYSFEYFLKNILPTSYRSWSRPAKYDIYIFGDYKMALSENHIIKLL